MSAFLPLVCLIAGLFYNGSKGFASGAYSSIMRLRFSSSIFFPSRRTEIIPAIPPANSPATIRIVSTIYTGESSCVSSQLEKPYCEIAL